MEHRPFSIFAMIFTIVNWLLIRRKIYVILTQTIEQLFKCLWRVRRETPRVRSSRVGEAEEAGLAENTKMNLSNVSETLMIPLYIRALESQRPDALIKDEWAEALVRELDHRTLQKTLALTEDFTRVAVILKTREFDRIARDFLSRNPEAVVVHIGCGLDTRFERVDNGQVEWYDLDLSDVIDLRRKLIGGEKDRYHLLAASMFEKDWLRLVETHLPRPYLFMAEGVFMYFKEAQVKSLVLTLHSHFPGAELVFDAFSPFMRWAHNVKVTRTRVGVKLHWGLKHARDLEGWGTASTVNTGIRLLGEKYPFQTSEPRIRRALKMRLFPFIATTIGVFHYQLS